LGNGAF